MSGKPPSVGWLLAEEVTRCVALEGGVSIPALGLALAAGADDTLLIRLAIGLFALPVVMGLGIFLYRLRHPDFLAPRPWDYRRTRAWIRPLVLSLVTVLGYLEMRALVAKRALLSPSAWPVAVALAWVVFTLTYLWQRWTR